jgi:crossover junction endodeoxyribonuclease RusA
MQEKLYDATVWIDKVVAKERPRKGAKGNFYTPARTKFFQELVGWKIRAAGFKQPSAAAFGVSLTVSLKPAANHPEQVIGAYAKESLVDFDNVLKSVLDGMNGIVYNDDRQVCFVTGRKVWGSETGLWIRVWELADE